MAVPASSSIMGTDQRGDLTILSPFASARVVSDGICHAVLKFALGIILIGSAVSVFAHRNSK